MKTIYLDHNATTPVAPQVVEAMLPFFTEHYGNPSSKRHAYGWAADEAVTRSREQLGSLLGAEPHEVLFTSGATEAANLAIKGFAEANARRGKHIVTVATEHKAVLEACRALQKRGWSLTVLPVEPDGRVSPSRVEEALQEDTVLVAVMWANNETGIIHPIEDISPILRDREVALFTFSWLDSKQVCSYRRLPDFYNERQRGL